ALRHLYSFPTRRSSDLLFPDISAEGGVLHATWWDSRMDPNYSPQRPVGNSPGGVTAPALDVFATRSGNAGASWSTATRITDVSRSEEHTSELQSRGHLV